MSSRRRFLKKGLAGTGAFMIGGTRVLANGINTGASANGPVVLSTWSFGITANKKAWEVLSNGGTVLDAVEQGVAVIESDLNNRNVGLGGLPDRDGRVTLDACIQDHDGRAGAVAFMQNFENPIKIARKVIKTTPHVMLAGSGAEKWALANGFQHKEVKIPKIHKR
jgi:N4-(beta-N-acetylglucosaminyl)-L-asparaginase